MKFFYAGLLCLVIATVLSSCTSYYLTTDALREQVGVYDSTQLKPAIISVRLGYSINVVRIPYLASPLDVIHCTDKAGNPVELKNGPRIEMRVTQKSGKRSIFYFDQIFVTDSTFTGVQSRFFPSIRKTIKWKDIKLIEVQDSKKNVHYE